MSADAKTQPGPAATAYRISINDAMEWAAKSVGVPGWQAFSWELVEGGSKVNGEVPDGVHEHGPLKGRPKFGGAGSTHAKEVFVPDAELQRVAAEHERDTGDCWDCKGTGQTWAGWSQAEGTKYRTCTRCSGTGKATDATAGEKASEEASTGNTEGVNP